MSRGVQSWHRHMQIRGRVGEGGVVPASSVRVWKTTLRELHCSRFAVEASFKLNQPFLFRLLLDSAELLAHFNKRINGVVDLFAGMGCADLTTDPSLPLWNDRKTKANDEDVVLQHGIGHF